MTKSKEPVEEAEEAKEIPSRVKIKPNHLWWGIWRFCEGNCKNNIKCTKIWIWTIFNLNPFIHINITMRTYRQRIVLSSNMVLHLKRFRNQPNLRHTSKAWHRQPDFRCKSLLQHPCCWTDRWFEYLVWSKVQWYLPKCHPACVRFPVQTSAANLCQLFWDTKESKDTKECYWICKKLVSPCI